ncbi:ALB3.2, partial [Symbiodinium natans]
MPRGRGRLRTPTVCLLAALAAWGSWRAASSQQFVPISARAPAQELLVQTGRPGGSESWTKAAVATLLAVPTAAVAEDGGDWFDPFVSLNANIIEAIDSVIGSAGAAVILYTIFIKVVTFPLQQPALRTTAMLQMLTPQLDEINRQYADDEDKKGKLLRELYAKVGLNPFLSLVPILFQIPLFVALFRAIGRLADQDDHFKEPFLWIPSLAGPVSQGKPSLDWLLKTRSSEAFEPLVGWQDAAMYCVLPLLVFVAQFLSSRLSSSSSENSTNGVLFPLFIGISTLVSPSGVGVYWLTNTVLTTAQMKVTQDEVAEEFPEYKKIKDEVDAKE